MKFLLKELWSRSNIKSILNLSCLINEGERPKELDWSSLAVALALYTTLAIYTYLYQIYQYVSYKSILYTHESEGESCNNPTNNTRGIASNTKCQAICEGKK